MAVEPGRRVAVCPGGGCGVPGRKEPVLNVALARTFASSRAAQVLNPVKEEIRVVELLNHTIVYKSKKTDFYYSGCQ